MPVNASFIAGRSRTVRLRRQLREARCRLFDFELDAEITEVRLRLRSAGERKRRHDLVNAFSAVEGASLIMSRETLSDADRSMITEVLDSGLSRLRAMLLEQAIEDDHRPLADLVTSVSGEPAWRGRLTIDMAADLAVSGPSDQITEVIRQLLTHASRFVPSAVLSLRADRKGDRVELWVGDRGARVAATRRDPMRHPSGGDAIEALHVATRLARELDGYVTVEPQQGGGESIGISWPAYVG